MTITKSYPGIYHVTGWVGRKLTQYAVHKTKAGNWLVNRTYGTGPTFPGTFKTKRAAVRTITTYGE